MLRYVSGLEPACYPYLSVTDQFGTTDSDVFLFIGGGEIFANDRISARDDQAAVMDTTTTRFKENYSYFYSRYNLGFSPEDDYSSDGAALKPATTQDYYSHSGNLTIQSPWEVKSGKTYVVFVDGDLNITDPDGVEELITVEEGGFLAFIVSGNIVVDSSVGHINLSDTDGNVEGVYVADGSIIISSNGGVDKRFVSEGTFVGWTNVSLMRNYNSEKANGAYPTETLIYRPGFIKYTPEKMKRSQMIWQETN